MALLDYVDRHNGLVSGGSVPARREEVTMPVYRSIGVSMDYPRTAGGDPTGHVGAQLWTFELADVMRFFGLT